MDNRVYGIPSWSHKVYRARATYICRNCGGTIPSGTKYVRHVERLGAEKGKDPLRNVHVHIDCEAPWHVVDTTPLLTSLGRLPAPTECDSGKSRLRPAVYVQHASVGTLQWQMPEVLTAKIASSSEKRAVDTVAEIERALALLLNAIVTVSGSKQKALRLSHLLQEMAQMSGGG